jgi:hypothetical protein
VYPEPLSSPGFALSVPERTTFTLSSTHFPSPEDGLLDLLHAIIVTDRGKDRGSSFSHHGGVSLHHVERSSDIGREVDLSKRADHVSDAEECLACDASKTHFVDDKEVRLRKGRVSRGPQVSLWLYDMLTCEIPGPPLRGTLSPPLTSIYRFEISQVSLNRHPMPLATHDVDDVVSQLSRIVC